MKLSEYLLTLCAEKNLTFDSGHCERERGTVLIVWGSLYFYFGALNGIDWGF